MLSERLNDRARVHLTVAGRDRFLEQLKMQARQRQAPAIALPVFQDQRNIFVMMLDQRLGFEIAPNHLLAFDVHSGRVAIAGSKQVKKGVEVQAKVFGEDEALGQYESVQPQHQVSGQLGLRPAARWPQIEDPVCEEMEETAAGFEGFPADHEE